MICNDLRAALKARRPPPGAFFHSFRSRGVWVGSRRPENTPERSVSNEMTYAKN
jgi:hypothetical protein